jgi:hypothetical protein
VDPANPAEAGGIPLAGGLRGLLGEPIERRSRSRIYIRYQADHHQTQSFQDELREWLRRYEIEWDERYVWD